MTPNHFYRRHWNDGECKGESFSIIFRLVNYSNSTRKTGCKKRYINFIDTNSYYISYIYSQCMSMVYPPIDITSIDYSWHTLIWYSWLVYEHQLFDMVFMLYPYHSISTIYFQLIFTHLTFLHQGQEVGKHLGGGFFAWNNGDF